MTTEEQKAKNREYQRRYSRTPKGIEVRRRATAKYRDTHPGEQLKMRARRAMRTALAAGYITKTPCIVCGEAKVEAHHHAGYRERYWLVVQWMCGPCHRAVHVQ